MTNVDVSIVVPTAGRPELGRLLAALAAADGPRPREIVVVDDRRYAVEPLPVRPGVRVVRGRAAGPAAARNMGWRAADGEWIAFLDDDTVPRGDWLRRLAHDLRDADPDVVGVQGRIEVPRPAGRAPTDTERQVIALESARWATADMAYRRAALRRVGGFDERFPRAFREDADLALRIRAHGRIVTGTRVTAHPLGDRGRMPSVRAQAGNADDVLMGALHGRRWRAAAGVPRGRRRRHLAIAAAGALALTAAVAGRRGAAATAGLAWGAGTLELTLARTRDGPGTPAEVAELVLTSALIPALATWHTLVGVARLPVLLADRRRRPNPGRRAVRPAAVLFDRDGTLIRDVPYNGDPDRVEPMPGAAEALRRLRAAGVPTAVVTNQSAIGRGLLSREQVDAVNRRLEDEIGPLGPVEVCPHAPEERCPCRKPSPGLIVRAARALGVPAHRCVVVGDIGADVRAARAVGARAVLVPTPVTRRREALAAPELATDLLDAVERLIGSGGPP